MATARSMVLNVGDSFGLHRFRVMKEASEEICCSTTNYLPTIPFWSRNWLFERLAKNSMIHGICPAIRGRAKRRIPSAWLVGQLGTYSLS